MGNVLNLLPGRSASPPLAAIGWRVLDSPTSWNSGVYVYERSHLSQTGSGKQLWQLFWGQVFVMCWLLKLENPGLGNLIQHLSEYSYFREFFFKSKTAKTMFFLFFCKSWHNPSDSVTTCEHIVLLKELIIHGVLNILTFNSIKRKFRETKMSLVVKSFLEG